MLLLKHLTFVKCRPSTSGAFTFRLQSGVSSVSYLKAAETYVGGIRDLAGGGIQQLDHF